MKKRLLGTSAVALVAALALAGCGNSAVSGGSTGSGGSSGSGGDKTVKIGMSSILSGVAASTGIAVDAGAKAYLQALNDKGGVNGYKFTFDEQDNQYDPAKAATIARTLVSDNAFLILTEGTPTLAATAPVAGNTPVLSVSDGGLLTPPTKYPRTFGVDPNFARVAAKGADFILNQLKAKQAGLVYVNTATGTPARDAFPAYFSAHGGQVVDTEAVAQSATDYSAFAQKLKQSGAPVVYAFILDSQLPGLQKAADAIGYHPKWVTWFNPYSPSYLKLAGNLATGTYVSNYTTPLSDTSDPNVQQYLTAMKKYAPSETNNAAAGEGWTLGAVIAKGVEQATSGGKTLTADNFVAALNNIADQPLGIVASMTYNSQTHAGATKSAFYSISSDGSLKLEQPYQELPQVPAS